MTGYVRALALHIPLALLFSQCAIQNTYALAESTGRGGSNVNSLHELGLTGEGVNIGVISGRNVRITHEAFRDANGVSRAFNYDFSGDGITISSHDTQLAGIIASRGGIGFPNDIGTAPGADIHCARVADNNESISSVFMTRALDELVNTHNCRVITTGFALVGLDPNGQSFWDLLYGYYAYEHDVLFANAAGNNGSTLTVFADAFNGITTGGLILNDPCNQYTYRRVGSISGSGPTSDGRRKPDVTAPAQNQTVPTSSSDTTWATVGTTAGETSYSVPQTAGVAAVLLNAADSTPNPDDGRNEVIRAVIVNSTFPNIDDKLGNQTNPADSNNTWHPDRGYGGIDALRAYEVLDSNEVATDVNIDQQRGWALGTLSPGQQCIYRINIAKQCRLVATLAWNRRVEWIDEKHGVPPRANGIIEPGELHPYLANLDMVVYPPGEADPIFSEQLFGLNPDDNLEKCDLLISTPGEYDVVIANSSGNDETADYGFAFVLHPLLVGDFTPLDYAVDYTDLLALALQWLGNDQAGELALVPDGIVNFLDFAVFADNWLQIDAAYYQQP